MVDAERASARLERLRELLWRLEDVGKGGEDAYLTSPEVRAMTERWLELAVQICIDLGTQLLMEGSARAPDSYAGVFQSMGEAGIMPTDLADRLSEAAKQRNLLVHLYMEIDDRKVFASLGSLDDLRQFAAVIGRELD